MKMKSILGMLLLVTALLSSCSNSNTKKTEFSSSQELKSFVLDNNYDYNDLVDMWGSGELKEPIININNNIGDHCIKVTWNNVKCNGSPVILCFKYDLEYTKKPTVIYPLYDWSDSFPQ